MFYLQYSRFSIYECVRGYPTLQTIHPQKAARKGLKYKNYSFIYTFCTFNLLTNARMQCVSTNNEELNMSINTLC